MSGARAVTGLAEVCRQHVLRIARRAPRLRPEDVGVQGLLPMGGLERMTGSAGLLADIAALDWLRYGIFSPADGRWPDQGGGEQQGRGYTQGRFSHASCHWLGLGTPASQQAGVSSLLVPASSSSSEPASQSALGVKPSPSED